MRTEQEMFNLILSIAKNDERIRAVFMNGSRTNINAKKDIFQDYDIEFVVKETRSFREDKNWIDKFGERLYMQYPEGNSFFPGDVENCYAWLIQFTDGNRLDLTVSTLTQALQHIEADKLCKLLLDKDKCLPNIPEATDEVHWVKKPTECQFKDACNEFWWCLNNVAKGLWREEVPYVMDMLNYAVRPWLILLLGWKIGFDTNFTVSTGKSGKYMYRWLKKEEWDTFFKTYPSGDVNDIWKSVFIMCDQFNDIAREVSYKLNVEYNEVEANNSLRFLQDVSILSKDAEKIY